MKKVLFALVAGAFITMSMNSCKSCGTCTSVADVKYCKGDSGYDAAKLVCGASWKAS